MFNFLKRKKNGNTGFVILGLIMLTNALSYGIIIPLLYPYAARFGMTPITLSFLFATYSLFQFISTPILGRLSDRYGRKPLLIICILGTSVAMTLFALATNIYMLFIARMIDGLTGGNISVAQAMVADEIKGKDRTKAFGMLGAAFGFGFLVGPAIGGLLSQISLSAPFWFAACLAFVAAILGLVKLKETVKTPILTKPKIEELFHMKAIVKSLFNPTIGAILIVSFIAASVSNSFMIGFNAYTVDVLKLSPKQVGLIFTMAGFMSILMQMGGIKVLLKKFKSKKLIIKISFIGSFFCLLVLSMNLLFIPFVFVIFIYLIFSSVITPMITGIISQRTKDEDQGLVLGLNQSYVSFGQIVGPLSAGLVSRISVSAIFVFAAIFMYVGFLFMQFSRRESRQVNI